VDVQAKKKGAEAALSIAYGPSEALGRQIFGDLAWIDVLGSWEGSRRVDAPLVLRRLPVTDADCGFEVIGQEQVSRVVCRSANAGSANRAL
jgi:hypothetical protein